MSIEEEGLSVRTWRLYSIHETPCFHFCIAERERGFLTPAFRREGETDLQLAKRKGIRIYRIHKDGSRIAFETEEEAFEHLRFLKGRQLNHMRREIEFVQRFLEATEGKTLPDLERDTYDPHQSVVPDTQELVREYYVFT